MKMAEQPPDIHPVARVRRALGWSQAELARQAGLPRSTVSAIETRQLTPSVTAALALARALACSVENLFGVVTLASAEKTPRWAWRPPASPARFWTAEVHSQRFLFPIEDSCWHGMAHDGVATDGHQIEANGDSAERTLVLACCDPGAWLLATEYARTTGFRMLVFERSGAEALDLLKRGLVHLAGLHRSTESQPELNLETVRSYLGRGYWLLHLADWEEGLAVRPANRRHSMASLVRSSRRWALREPGSAARECLEQWIECRSVDGQVVHGHRAVALAVRSGWADAGVCVRLAAEESRLDFFCLRRERLDLCFPGSLRRDPRIRALLQLIRTSAYRRQVNELPGYTPTTTGELEPT
ncbi:MAG: substrate-binding domain-containing protein [Verrucomicrobiota bacterium]|nr:helix-turn-helix domain-containing protein [Limisphaera sp.]MDW8380614.1 substrate-binding domain-containing protein [Verrucomicrobiota bacterium]